MDIVLLSMLALFPGEPVPLNFVSIKDGCLLADRLIKTAKAEKTFLINDTKLLVEYSFDGELITQIDIRGIKCDMDGKPDELDDFNIATGAFLPSGNPDGTDLYALVLLRPEDWGIRKRVAFFDIDNGFLGFGFVDGSPDIYFDQIWSTKQGTLANVYEKRYEFSSQYWFLQEINIKPRDGGGYDIALLGYPFFRNTQSEQNLINNFRSLWLTESESTLMGIGQIDRRLTTIGQFNKRGLEVLRFDKVSFEPDIPPYSFPEPGQREGVQQEGRKKEKSRPSRSEWFYSFVTPTALDHYKGNTYALSYRSPNADYNWKDAVAGDAFKKEQAIWEGKAPFNLNIILIDIHGKRVGGSLTLGGNSGNLAFMLGTRDKQIFTFHQAGQKYWIERHDIPQ